MIDARPLAAVGAGAALGGMLRLAVTEAVVARYGSAYAFAATAFINVSGSFLIGIIAELARERADLPTLLRLFLATGVLGGYTTFSTFSLETLGFASAGAVGGALAYALGSVALGLLAAVAGTALVRSI